MTGNAERYPWDQVPRLTRDDARLLTALAHGLAAVDHAMLDGIIASLLGSTVTAVRIEAAGKHRPSSQATFVELSGDMSVVCEVPGTLASWIVDRALGGGSKFVSLDAGLTVRDETSRGVLAYVTARVLHALQDTHSVHSVDAGSPAVRARLDAVDARCVAVMLCVETVPTSIHIWTLGPIAVREPVPCRANRQLAEQLLLEPAVLSAQLNTTILLRASSATTLLFDDVLVLQAAGITATHEGYQGTVKLMVLGARVHHWIARARNDRLELEQRHTTGDDRMTTGTIETNATSNSETLAAVMDAPLELSIEIARFTLPLGEIATLSKGDVLLTGRPIGEHVTLRTGTRAIATGELVNVEGAIGVRIVTLAGG